MGLASPAAAAGQCHTASLGRYTPRQVTRPLAVDSVSARVSVWPAMLAASIARPRIR